MLRVQSKPVRRVLRWQAIATLVLMVLGATYAGAHGAFSALLGGAVSICAGWAAAVVANRRKAPSAGEILIVALLAEVTKIGLIVVLLWLVLMVYAAVVAPVFIGAFVVTALIFAMAFFVRD